MLTRRLAEVRSLMFAVFGLDKAAFDLLPLIGTSPTRKTADHYARRAARNRYTGADLRAIRAKGQHRECRRRRHAMLAAA